MALAPGLRRTDAARLRKALVGSAPPLVADARLGELFAGRLEALRGVASLV